MKQLNINPVFRDLIQSLTADEFKQLEDNVLAEGIRDAIVVWNDTIVDGHNRYQLAQKHSLQFDLHEVNFNSQEGRNGHRQCTRGPDEVQTIGIDSRRN